MYFDYLKERENIDIIKNDSGFLIYKIEGKILIVVDVYIKPEHRKNRNASSLTFRSELLAKEKGCETIACQVDLLSNNPENSAIAILKYGFKLSSAENGIITFSKEV